MAPKERSDTNLDRIPPSVDVELKEKPMVKYWFGEFEQPLVWKNIIILGILHLIGLYGFFTFPYRERWGYFLFIFFFGNLGGIGVTMGAHRLWTHRTFKATLPLRILLITMYASAGQYSVYQWARDHRLHHKHSDTVADPHNSNRGLFYSHIGWFFMKRTPESITEGKKIDSSDILADPVVKVYMKFWIPFHIFMAFIGPAMLWNYLFGFPFLECLIHSTSKFIANNNLIWCINSLAHYDGARTYNKKINPREVRKYFAVFLLGEGFHNYHHTFPWDYKVSELGEYMYNVPALLIDAFAKIGWAYDLKSPSDELVRKVIQNHGDGSHFIWGKEVPHSAETDLGLTAKLLSY